METKARYCFEANGGTEGKDFDIRQEESAVANEASNGYIEAQV